MFKTKRTVFEINNISDKCVSKKMGCDRGTPIDRYYIEKFLQNNSEFIRGTVMEIGDDSYTLKYGKKVDKSMVLTQDSDHKYEGAIKGDLVTGEGCTNESLDCFIITQTLPFIYDINSAAKNIVNVLKNGGVALCTVRGISMLSKYDDSRWGDYWGFTVTSLQKLFAQYVGYENVDVQSWGNPKIATAFLFGLCQEDLQEKDFLTNDELCPVIITAKVKKAENN